MRERNLYLEKCRRIEELGEGKDWGGEEDDDDEDFDGKAMQDQKLLQEVYEILYTEI